MSVPAVLPAVAETLDALHNSEGDYFEGAITTNNKGKLIFPYQLGRGIFEQDLIHAKVKGFK